MKKFELRQIIREQIKSILKESDYMKNMVVVNDNIMGKQIDKNKVLVLRALTTKGAGHIPENEIYNTKSSDKIRKADKKDYQTFRLYNKDLDEKAVSKSQQRFFGMVDAAQKGEKPASKEIGDVAKKIKKSDVKDFARTKHDNLPEKAPKKENVNEAGGIYNQPGNQLIRKNYKTKKPLSGYLLAMRFADEDFKYTLKAGSIVDVYKMKDGRIFASKEDTMKNFGDKTLFPNQKVEFVSDPIKEN